MKNKIKKGIVFMGIFIGGPQLIALLIFLGAIITVLPMGLYGLYFQNKISPSSEKNLS